MDDRSGVGEVTRFLYDALSSCTELEVSVLAKRSVQRGLLRQLETLKCSTAMRFDWVFVPRLAPLPANARRLAVVVHDLGSLDRPQEYPKLLLRERTAVSRAHAVFAVSDFTASSIKRHFPRVNPVPLHLGAINPVHSRPAHDKFLLSVAANRPNKRLAYLLDTWERTGPQHPDWKLVLVSNFTPERLPPRTEIRSAVSDEVLAALFECCSGFVSFSAYEGLGLPLYTALASGIPTIASNIPPYGELLAARAGVPIDASVAESADYLSNFLSRISSGQGAEYRAPRPDDAIASRTHTAAIIERALSRYETRRRS
ncbi:glycosyltransferase [Mycolicibacterium monacense DSM 44395]|nr:glycosyltransferase [Mycolicibacterium monacense DSM 44395]